MSIPAALEDLERTLREYGAGYLLTTGGGRVKAVTVEPRVADGVLEITTRSGGSARNLGDEPAATLLFPPAGAGEGTGCGSNCRPLRGVATASLPA